MTEQIKDVVAVKHNVDYCSSCSVCSTLCPYDAFKKDDTGKIVLDVTKCQVCGLCYSNCPAKVIDTIYYDFDTLIAYLEKSRREQKTDTLVIMCRGSAPDMAGVKEMFEVSNFIPLLVPCVGRIPDEVYLKAMLMGIDKIKVLACDVDYCRFERGSATTERKVFAMNQVLNQLGYGSDIIDFKKHSLKVAVDSNLCIACGNCVYFCPYDAAKLESPGGISFDLDKCRGCGLCVAMCPAFALELDNWEQDRISRLIGGLAAEMVSPKILVFRCQWASFPPLNGAKPTNVRYIDLPCASRVDRSHVLEAFQNGVDGVMVVGCSEDECKQEKASGKAQHSMEALTARLGQLDLNDRLYYCSVSPRYPDEMDQHLAQFTQQITTAKGDSK